MQISETRISNREAGLKFVSRSDPEALRGISGAYQ